MTETYLSVGDVVIDLVDDHKSPGDLPKLIVLAVNADERADEHEISDLEGMTLAEAAYDWPIREMDEYDPDADHVVEAAYIESLDHAFGGVWRTMDFETLRKNVETSPRTKLYSFHAHRLEPASTRREGGSNGGGVAGP
jgi:hypothetical protein